jgi:hypothetical protein
VPFIFVDHTGQWELRPPQDAGIASMGATVLALFGVDPPEGYLPALIAPRA